MENFVQINKVKRLLMDPAKQWYRVVKMFCLIRALGPILTNIISLFLEKKVATTCILNVKSAFHGKKLLPIQKNHEMLEKSL